MPTPEEEHVPDTTSRPSGGSTRSRNGVLAGLAVLVLAVVAVLALVVQVAGQGDDDGAVEDRAVPLSQEAFDAVSVGEPKEEVLSRLEPATPVDSAVLDRFDLREPPAVAAECVYYESEGGPADDVYRLCFADDVLRDKTVVLPPGDGVTGDDARS